MKATPEDVAKHMPTRPKERTHEHASMKATPEDVAKERPADEDERDAPPASMKATPEDVAKVKRIITNKTLTRLNEGHARRRGEG